MSLEDMPGVPPPPGQKSNFVNPDSRAELTIIACSIFIGLMMIFGMLRVYSRLWVARCFSKDDCKSLGSQNPLNAHWIQMPALRPWYAGRLEPNGSPLTQWQVCLISYAAVVFDCMLPILSRWAVEF